MQHRFYFYWLEMFMDWVSFCFCSFGFVAERKVKSLLEVNREMLSLHPSHWEQLLRSDAPRLQKGRGMLVTGGRRTSMARCNN